MKAVPLVTLLTDFGLEDPFVGVMKGVILTLSSFATIVDVCHQISPHDVVQAAYQWKAAYSYFPTGSIHVGVIDPGVGGERKGILAVSERYYYIAPDNGLLTLIERDDPFIGVYELKNSDLQLAEVSSTFHGRDIFAPAAGYLVRGVQPGDFGPRLDGIKRLDLPDPFVDEEGILHGRIMAVDRFGNLLTDVKGVLFRDLLGQGRFELVFRGKEINRFRKFYTEEKGAEPFVLVNSAGYLEIALTNFRADRQLGGGVGDRVTIKFLA